MHIMGERIRSWDAQGILARWRNAFQIFLDTLRPWALTGNSVLEHLTLAKTGAGSPLPVARGKENALELAKSILEVSRLLT